MLEPKKPDEGEGDGAKGKDVEAEKNGKTDKGGVDPDKGEK